MFSRRARDLGLSTALRARLGALPIVFMLSVVGIGLWLSGTGLFVVFVIGVGTTAALVLALLVTARRGERAVTGRTRRLVADHPDHVVFSALGDLTATGEILRFRSSDAVLEVDGRWTVEATPALLRIWCGVHEDAVAVEWPWSAVRTVNLARDGRPPWSGARPHPALSLGIKHAGRAAVVRLTVVSTSPWQVGTAPVERWMEARDGLRALRDRARAREEQAGASGT